MGGILGVWVVYRRPADMPDAEYVVRKQTATSQGVVPSPTYFRASTLEMARLSIPDGLTRLDRYPDDEPHIVETWI